jgi:hypothetical protein
MKKMLLGFVGLMMCAAVPANAALTVNNGTGLISVPTAEALAPMTLQVAADYYNTDDFMAPMRAEFGVIQGLEIGGNYTYLDGADDDFFSGNVKYVLPMQFVENLNIAGFGLYGAQGDLSEIQVGAVATYGMELEGIKLGLTAGFDWAQWDFDGASEDGIGILIGGEVGLDGMVPGLGVVVEYDGGNIDGDDDSLGLGVRYTVMENLTVQGGMKDYGDMEFFFGAQYALSFGN